ncbi:MAG: ABC transporter permease [Spirochaetia bacterium]|jgi:ribose/xylose/arabinose/galactoside ABC-type transport system permease subunit
MNTKRRVTREFTLGVIVFAYMLFLGLTTGFGSTSGLFSMMLDVSPTIVGAIALSLIIFTGNIDISAGTILGFVGFVAAILAKAGLPIFVWLPAGLLTGMLLAGLNGWISVTFKVPTIVVTLAMNMVHIGFYVTFLPNAGWVLNLSDAFTALGQGRFFGLVPYIFVIAVAVAALFIWIIKYTSFGKSLYAVGGNRQASIYAGINPDRTVLVAFLVEGLLLGVAGILKATTANRLMPSVFQGREMIFIAAAVVGGVNIMGGAGKLLGAVFGAVLVYLLSITMIYLGFQDYFQFALQGIIILIAVFITVTNFGPARKSLRKVFGPKRTM